MTETQKEECHQIALYYGLHSQAGKAVEENIELSHALLRLIQGKIPVDDEKSLEEVLTEIADVQIMIEQIQFLLNSHKTVENIISEKIQRQQKRIQEEWDRILNSAQKDGALECTKSGTR